MGREIFTLVVLNILVVVFVIWLASATDESKKKNQYEDEYYWRHRK